MSSPFLNLPGFQWCNPEATGQGHKAFKTDCYLKQKYSAKYDKYVGINHGRDHTYEQQLDHYECSNFLGAAQSSRNKAGEEPVPQTFVRW